MDRRSEHGRRALEQRLGRRDVAAVHRATAGVRTASPPRAPRSHDPLRRSGRARSGSGRPARGGSRGSPRTRCSRPRSAFTRSAQATNRSWSVARARLSSEPYTASLDHDVPEPVDSSRSRRGVAVDELLAAQRPRGDGTSGRSASGDELLDRRLREREPDDRGRLHDRPLLAGEVVEAGREQGLDRRRHRELARSPGRSSGRRRAGRAPLSTSIETSCSTNSGLPSAAATTRAVTLASTGRRAAPRRSARCPRRSSGGMAIDRDARLGSHQSGVASRQIAAGRCRRRASATAAPSLERGASRRSRNVCLGRSGCRRSRGRRPLPAERLEEPAGAPEELGDRELGVREPDDRRRPGPRIAARGRGRPRRAASILSRASSGVSSSTIAAAARTTSTSGQNVMPSPYGRQRPREHGRRRSTSRRELADRGTTCRRRPRRRR